MATAPVAPLVLAILLQQAETPAVETPEQILGKPANWRLEEDAHRSTIAVERGTALLADPWDGAWIVGEAPGGPLPVWGRTPGWRQVVFGNLVGWIRTDRTARPTDAAPDAPSREAQSRSSVVAPHSIRKLLLDRAGELLGERATTRKLGPFELLTDLQDEKLLSFLDHLATSVEDAYEKSYELGSQSGSEGTLILFSRKWDYRVLRSQATLGRGEPVDGFEMDAVAVLHREQRDRAQLQRVFVHELTHVLNRWHLAPSAPLDVSRPSEVALWLEEGIATDLSFSRIDRRGRIDAKKLSREVRRAGGFIHYDGATAGLLSLAQRIRSGSLPTTAELVTLEREDFLSSEEASIHYLQSATLVRFLSNDAGLRAPFLAFLQAVSQGRTDSTDLLQALPIEPVELDRRYREWTLDLARGEIP